MFIKATKPFVDYIPDQGMVVAGINRIVPLPAGAAFARIDGGFAEESDEVAYLAQEAADEAALEAEEASEDAAAVAEDKPVKNRTPRGKKAAAVDVAPVEPVADEAPVEPVAETVADDSDVVASDADAAPVE